MTLNNCRATVTDMAINLGHVMESFEYLDASPGINLLSEDRKKTNKQTKPWFPFHLNLFFIYTKINKRKPAPNSR